LVEEVLWDEGDGGVLRGLDAVVAH